MAVSIQEHLAATGVAQVIVVLRGAEGASPAGMRDAGVALERGSTVSLRQVAAGLERAFLRTTETRDGAIVAAARDAKTRGGRARAKTRAAMPSLERAVAGGTTAVPGSHYFENLGIMLGSVDADGLRLLEASRGVVAQVVLAPEFSLIRPVATARAASEPGPTWGLKALKVPELRAMGLTGKGVLVGHLDTGVDGSHPALKDAVLQFAEFDFLGRPVPGATPHDSDEHGTHTAGTIAGRSFRRAEFGVAPGASLACALVIEGGNVIARVLAGLNWAVGLKVRVISMSLGLRGVDQSFLPVTQIIRARGILPVFAVGNEGPGTSRSPGNYDEALSVGASDAGGNVADFSSSQRFIDPTERFVPDLVAPGVDTLSSIPGGTTELLSGTSMATPHVAGLAALLFEAFPSATPAQVEAAIFESSKRTAGMTEARGGRGIPDGVKALNFLGEALGMPSAVVAAAAATQKAKPKVKKAAAKPRTKTKPSSKSSVKAKKPAAARAPKTQARVKKKAKSIA